MFKSSHNLFLFEFEKVYDRSITNILIKDDTNNLKENYYTRLKEQYVSYYLVESVFQ